VNLLLAPFTNLLLRNFNRRLQHRISSELSSQETLKSLDVAYNQLIESEKMVVLGQLVTGAAHELNNPIAAILRGSDSLKALIFTLLGCNDPPLFSQLARQTLQQGLSLMPLSTFKIRQKTNQLLPKIKCHPIKLEQVWTNIISNAIDATGDTGIIKISTVYLPHDEAPSIQVIIEDNGPGVSARNLIPKELKR
jgi:C4-dicarboxylate-specific signal transduction histidine kinase